MQSNEAMKLYINMVKDIILSLENEEEKQEDDLFMTEEEFQKTKSEKVFNFYLMICKILDGSRSKNE